MVFNAHPSFVVSFSDVVKSLLDKLEKYQSTMIPPGNKPIVEAANPYLHGGNWEPWVEPDMTFVKLRP